MVNATTPSTPHAAQPQKGAVVLTTSSSTIFTTDCMGSVEVADGRLTVVGRTFPKGTDVEAILAGEAVANVVRLCSDGRAWVDAWHEGPESGEVAYVERHEAGAGRVFHGWVDAASRRLVQVG